MLTFDVPPPFQSEGIDAYRKTWDLFFGWMAGTPKFELSDVRITAGQEVAFVMAHGQCSGPNGHGGVEELDFRLSLGLRKSDGRWVIEHEHHSVPAT
jgi:ketosteroid isomerase-like protein